VIAILIAAGVLHSVSRPNGQFRHLEDVVVYGASIEASATATEGQSSTTANLALFAIIYGCCGLTIILAAARIVKHKKRKDSNHGKERPKTR